MNSYLKTSWVRFGLTSVLIGLSGSAFAGGFQLYEASVASEGNAFAGTGAVAEDASTEFYNPAGMTLLKEPQISLAGTLLNLNTKVDFSSAQNTTQLTFPFTSYSPVTSTAAAPGSNSAHAGGWSLIPAFHFVYPWKKIALGFGVTAPFGLETDYGTSSMASFIASKSKLQVINIGPSFAFQLTPKFSLGLGLDVQYLTTELDQLVALLPTNIPLPFPSPLPSSIGPLTGNFINKGHSVGYGWNGGVLYQLSDATRLGLSYHSKVAHNITGDSTLDITSGYPLLEQLESTFGGFTSHLTMPDYANFSVYHELNQKWALLGGVDYTHWSTLQNVTLNFNGPIDASLNNVTVPLDFRNTWRLSVGANYKPDDHWTLRSGIAYDQSPVRSAEQRTFRLPDTNRYWLALGAGYKFNQALSVDVAYAHLFTKKVQATETQVNSADVDTSIDAALISSVTGDVASSVNEFGVQLNWNLDAASNGNA